jgi:hypothetical protein
MKKHLFTALILLFCLTGAAQYDEPKFGKIENPVLSMTGYDKDSTADALVLFDHGYTKFMLSRERKFQIVYERHCRIKLFKKSAFRLANISISLYKGSSGGEVLNELKAATFNLVKGELVKTKLDNDNVFKEERKNRVITKFAFPDVKEGSVIEYSYTITSDFLYNLRGWTFQYSCPAIWSQYTFIVPEYFNYRQMSKGYLPFDVFKTEQGQEIFTVHYDAELTPGLSGGRQAAENYDLKAATTQTILAIKNVPAFISEPNIDCEDNYIQSIEFELSSIQYPQEARKDYTQSWGSVNEEMNKDEDFGKLLKSNGFIDDTVASVCKNKTTDLEKAGSIYTYVQQRMKWNGDDRIYASKGLKKPFTERAGSSAEINLLLTVMLQTAGLKANPVMFSTRDNGFAQTFYPTMSKYNSVLASVDIEGKGYLLDATSKYCPFGVLPANDINGQGRVVNAADGDWVNLDATEKYREVKSYILEISQEGTFKGTILGRYDGYAGIACRSIIGSHKTNADYFREMQEQTKGLTISSFAVSNVQDISKPVVDSLHVEIADQTEMIGDKMIFYPMLFERMEENRYVLEERKYPVDYNFPISETYVFEYTLPAGYQVESLPAPVSFKLPDGSISISYSLQTADNKIRGMYKRNITRIQFLPAEYKSLKELYDLIVKKHGEQVILKKTG